MKIILARIELNQRLFPRGNKSSKGILSPAPQVKTSSLAMRARNAKKQVELWNQKIKKKKKKTRKKKEKLRKEEEELDEEEEQPYN